MLTTHDALRAPVPAGKQASHVQATGSLGVYMDMDMYALAWRRMRAHAGQAPWRCESGAAKKAGGQGQAAALR